jgi:hypothetical protein
MNQVKVTRTLRGRTTVVGPGILDVQCSARGTRVASRLVFADESTFSEEGTIDFGRGDRISFRSIGSGTLERPLGGDVRHGASVLEIADGVGRYAGARGRITSNFVLSPDGAITDEQVLVLFIQGEERT